MGFGVACHCSPGSLLSPASSIAERAARFSALGGGRNFQHFGFLESGKLYRVSSCSEIRMRDGLQFHMDNGELGSPPNEPSLSGRIIAGGENNVRKRKVAAAKGKGKAVVAANPVKVTEEEEDPKRSTSSSGDEDIKPKAKNRDKKQGKENNANTEEPLRTISMSVHEEARSLIAIALLKG